MDIFIQVYTRMSKLLIATLQLTQKVISNEIRGKMKYRKLEI